MIQIHSVGFPANSFFVYEQVYDDNGVPIEGLYVDRNGDGMISLDDRYRYENPAADASSLGLLPYSTTATSTLLSQVVRCTEMRCTITYFPTSKKFITTFTTVLVILPTLLLQTLILLYHNTLVITSSRAASFPEKLIT
ncbi:MAG: hypothetical protein R3B93_00570 [Bacteroidia bacterium]